MRPGHVQTLVVASQNPVKIEATRRGFTSMFPRRTFHLHAVEVFSGALLLFVGALVFVNRLTWMAGKLSFLNGLVLWLEKSLTGTT